ncbi:MAG: hypothetical protein U0232_23845 [Thermomicrobiales bacterium]
MEQRDADTFLHVDRRAFAIGTLHDDSDEREYWSQQTPQQRLAHVEQHGGSTTGPRRYRATSKSS